MSTESGTPPSEKSWRCFTCREGLLVTHRATWRNSGLPQVSPSHNLPDSSLKDDEQLREPPLSIELDDEEIADLISAHSPLAIAATFSGPPQDKTTNQDFAVSAVLRGPSDQPWAFAAVADGVSMKTFWPARAARISALIAFRVVRRAVRAGFSFDDEQLNQMRIELARELLVALRRDQKTLKEEIDLHPEGWTHKVYREHIDNDAYWYNSTLLVACLGYTQGFLLWAGDGGISILKTAHPGAPTEETVPLTSTDDLTVGTFVSLNVTDSQFSIGRISYLPVPGTVEVCLASDGVDRTLQRENLTYRQLSKDLRDPLQARKRLKQLASRPGRELDNYSFAWIVGPPPPVFEGDQVEPLSGARAVAEPQSSWSDGDPHEISLPKKPEEESVKPFFMPNEPQAPRAPVVLRTRWIGLASLALTFVIGLLVGTFIGHLPLPLGRTKVQKNPHNPKVKTSLTIKVPETILIPQKPIFPLLIADADRAALDAGNLSLSAKKQILEWAQFLERQPTTSKIYSVVVYAQREKLNDRQNCQRNAKFAESRAKTLVRHLKEMITTTEAARHLDPQGHYDVCDIPAGVADLRSLEARRAVLTEDVPVCDCNNEPQVSKKKLRNEKSVSRQEVR
jgi:hypothetical protein